MTKQVLMVAAHHLARLSMVTAAQAAVLTQGDELVASAGQLGPSEILELARLARESWSRFGGQDALMQYGRLATDGPVYLLYSLSAPSRAVLSLAFQVDTPLGVIRRQARELAQALPPQLALTPGSPPEAEEGPSEDELGARAKPSLSPPEGLPPWLEALATYPPFGAEPGAPGDPQAERAPGSGSGAERGGFGARAGDWQPQHIHLPSAPEVSPPAIGEISLPADSRPTAGELTYALVLAPKLPEYRLEGRLAARLEELLRSYALAFHWRVVRLEVEIGHVLAVLDCPAGVAPRQIVGRLKRLTSETLFNEFPQLLGQDPSRDFWAPGWLLVTTGQAPGPQEIAEYVASVRRRQGLSY